MMTLVSIRSLAVLLLHLTFLGSSHSQPGYELTSDPNSPILDADILRPGQALCNDAEFALVMQDDGNLMLYDISGGALRVIWSAGVFENGRRNLLLDSTGELIIFDDTGAVVWRSFFVGPTTTIYYAFVTDNGNFVVVNEQNWVVWQSSSHFFKAKNYLRRPRNKKYTSQKAGKTSIRRSKVKIPEGGVAGDGLQVFGHDIFVLSTDLLEMSRRDTYIMESVQ